MLENKNIINEDESRGENKKSGFKEKKENTIKSLREVECFLCNWKRACRGIGLFKLLK